MTEPPRQGSTAFLVALIQTDKAKLAKADPVKLAQRYGVDDVAWVRGSIRHWLGLPL